MPHGSQEVERGVGEREREAGGKILSTRLCSQEPISPNEVLPPNFHHLPLVYSAMNLSLD